MPWLLHTIWTTTKKPSCCGACVVGMKILPPYKDRGELLATPCVHVCSSMQIPLSPFPIPHSGCPSPLSLFLFPQPVSFQWTTWSARNDRVTLFVAHSHQQVCSRLDLLLLRLQTVTPIHLFPENSLSFHIPHLFLRGTHTLSICAASQPGQPSFFVLCSMPGRLSWRSTAGCETSRLCAIRPTEMRRLPGFV